MDSVPDWQDPVTRNSTLVCVMTDASLDKLGCSRVARMASAGVARAIDPVYTDVDGDTVFCLASGSRPGGPLHADRGRNGRGAGHARRRSVQRSGAGCEAPPVRPLRRSYSARCRDRSRPRRSSCGASATARPTACCTSTAPTAAASARSRRGSRRPRSRFGGRLEPFFCLDLVLHKGRGELATVTAAHTLAAHPNLRSSGPALDAAARALRRGAAAARRGGGEPRRLQRPAPLPRRCSTARSRRAGSRRSRRWTAPRASRRRWRSG